MIHVIARAVGSLVGAIALATTAPAAAPVRHSGLVVSVDHAAGRLVLSELGRASTLARRVVTLTEATRVVRWVRVPDAPSGFTNDFVEVVVDTDEIRPGVFVTVEALRAGGRLVATRIAVIAPPGSR